MDINSIDTNKTIWQLICDKLMQNGFNVFPPATKIGECKNPYVVLKEDGKSQINDYSSEAVYYRFLLYVPRNSYSILDEMEKNIRNVLDNELYPLIMPTGQTDPDYYDDNYNAHMRAFFYRCSKRNKHL